MIPSPNKTDRRHIEQVRSNLSIVSSESKRLAALVTNVLDIAKMESGTQTWKREPVHLNELAKATVQTTAASFSSAVELITDLAPDMVSVTADTDRIHQVMLNLISNAAKFTEMGTVSLRTWASDAHVHCEVSDTGIGIAEDELGSVFDSFRQVGGDSLTEKPLGTGLGLAICREIVTAHGGELSVSSTVGVGTQFAFSLPR